MKIVHLATSLEGGAGIAARRIVEAQVESGLDSTLIGSIGPSKELKPYEALARKNELTKFKTKTLTFAQTHFIQRSNLLVTPISTSLFSLIENEIEDADIVHVHAFYNFLNMRDLIYISKSKQVFVTMHDERFFTGGCHYSLDCDGYKTNCDECPQVSWLGKLLPKYTLAESKKQLMKAENLHFITPSTWLAEQAKKSSLLFDMPVSTISNPVPSQFYPNSKIGENSGKNFSSELTVGFVSENLNNPYKGLETLRRALVEIGNKRPINLNLFGSGIPGSFPPYTKVKVSKFETESGAQIAMNSCDVIVVPSLQDNSPSVVSESLMCGTPVIGSSSGGLPEMLRQFNQTIFSVSNSSELAEKIMNFVPHKLDAVTLASVRNKYSYTASASKHKKLYKLHI